MNATTAPQAINHPSLDLSLLAPAERSTPLNLDLDRSRSINQHADLLDLDLNQWLLPSDPHSHFDMQQAQPLAARGAVVPTSVLNRERSDIWLPQSPPAKRAHISTYSTDDSGMPGCEHWAAPGVPTPGTDGPVAGGSNTHGPCQPPIGACLEPLRQPAAAPKRDMQLALENLIGEPAADGDGSPEWRPDSAQRERSSSGRPPRSRGTLSRPVTKGRTSELSEGEKKERRRQSNRESARRSRARKIEEVVLHEQRVAQLEADVADKQARLQERERQVLRLKQTVAELNRKCRSMHSEMQRLLRALSSDHNLAANNEVCQQLTSARQCLSAANGANGADSDALRARASFQDDDLLVNNTLDL